MSACGEHRAVGEFDFVANVVTVVLNGADGCGLGVVCRVVTQVDLLGPYEDLYVVAVWIGTSVFDGDDADGRGRKGGVVAGDDAEDEVGLADETSNPRRGGRPVELVGCAELFDVAGLHHGDSVTKYERFILVVGDEHGGDADVAHDASNFSTDLDAQGGVEC